MWSWFMQQQANGRNTSDIVYKVDGKGFDEDNIDYNIDYFLKWSYIDHFLR